MVKVDRIFLLRDDLAKVVRGMIDAFPNGVYEQREYNGGRRHAFSSPDASVTIYAAPRKDLDKVCVATVEVTASGEQLDRIYEAARKAHNRLYAQLYVAGRPQPL